ncbi:phenylalanyl-tRNA synthetase [Gamsiella multidivaricata]|uniref:phenylalanyl-tRNA synthetase n=1 Tax=Gamsiella multidivaricata TaxID=101098 RepID=UPI00221EFB32|nr:phenylalanyl-tRNA synthetase [Gamsiella multidivaricata]KAI7829004.1 phenylalanyl-tRNA synthetase [Gamsiella multidivaricata]
MATGMFRAASQHWHGRALRVGASPKIRTMLFGQALNKSTTLTTGQLQRTLRPVLCASFHSSPFRSTSDSGSNPLKEPPTITKESITVGGKTYETDHLTNVTPTILEKTTRQLHRIPTHPVAIIKDLIASAFPDFKHYETFSPVVTTKENFDDLCFTSDHPGRAATDTYYLNEKIMLRTHTSAHQLQVMTEADKVLVTADVYRRDEIDASHYPVFHQMEGAQLFDAKTAVEDIRKAIAADSTAQFGSIHTTDTTVITSQNPKQDCHDEAAMLATADHLKHSLNMMVRKLFSHEKDLQVRWIDAQFPFTSPSWEMEILYQGKWLEVLGCGVIRQDILNRAGKPDKIGWAFGLGLERLALVLFGIPDIRLFWSQDERFLRQFEPSKIQKFKHFSKYPPCIKDISFWTNSDFHENNFCEIVRDVAGDIAETVEMIDEFTHPKTKKRSVCYRINYRSMDRNVTNAEINEIQEKLREQVVDRMKVELR